MGYEQMGDLTTSTCGIYNWGHHGMDMGIRFYNSIAFTSINMGLFYIMMGISPISKLWGTQPYDVRYPHGHMM